MPSCMQVCKDNFFLDVKDSNYDMKFWDDSKCKWNQERAILEKIEFRVWIKWLGL